MNKDEDKAVFGISFIVILAAVLVARIITGG